MPIPLLQSGSSIAVEQMNAAAAAADDLFRKLFSDCSPLLFLPLDGAASWRGSGLCGMMAVFGTQSARRIFATIPTHDQTAFDQIAATAPILGYEHTLKQVTLNIYPTDLDGSLKVHKRWVLLTPTFGGPQFYFVRVLALSHGGTDYYLHEHRHDLAVLDVVFEGHSPRTFTFPATFDRFSCIRFHNLDADEMPLVITLEAEVPLVLQLPRWKCVTVRRYGDSWIVQGFILWRTTEQDLDRFGGTFPWNNRWGLGVPSSVPLREADAANNVASVASLWRALDYFTDAQCPPELLSSCGGGLTSAFDPHTGLHVDQTKLINDTALAGMPSPASPSTPLWRLAAHGGSFVIVRNYAPDPDPVPAVIERHSATIDELLAGGHDSGVKLAIADGQLRLFLEDAHEAATLDLLPIGMNLTAGLPVTLTPGEYYVIPWIPIPPRVQMVRLSQVGTVHEQVLGIDGSAIAEYSVLGIETSSDGLVPPAYSQTVGIVRDWKFLDDTRDNSHSTFHGATTAWDGRRFVAHAEASFSPHVGSHLGDGVANDLVRRRVRATVAGVNLDQAFILQAFPVPGGIWGTPEHARGAFIPVPQGTHHALAENVYGDPSGGDWRAGSTTSTPESAVARLEAVPEALNYQWSCAGYRAQDSAVFLSNWEITPEWWAPNRAAVMASAALPEETRPDISIPLLHHHYNALAARLNAVDRVVPFTFLDAVWYGREFRPDNGDNGLFAGYIYPGDHLCHCEAGSVAAARAATLGIPIQTIATGLPGLAALADITVRGIAAGHAPYVAFPHANLINDLLLWFNPSLHLAYGDFTMISSAYETGAPPPGFTEGPAALPGDDTFLWYATSNPEASIPDFRWLNIADVQQAASDLGIPFRIERLCLPLKIKVWDPAQKGYGSRQNAIATRTQAMLVSDPSATPQLVAYAGRGNPLNTLRWAPVGTVRLARWPVYPGPGLATGDVEVNETVCALDRGYNRDTAFFGFTPVLDPFALLVGSSPTHQVSDDRWRAWWQNGSPFSSEAPRIFLQTVIPDGVSAGHLLALPVPAVQWGVGEIVASPPPATGPRTHHLGALPAIVTPDALAVAGGVDSWDGRGGWQISLIPGGITIT